MLHLFKPTKRSFITQSILCSILIKPDAWHNKKINSKFMHLCIIVLLIKTNIEQFFKGLFLIKKTAK